MSGPWDLGALASRGLALGGSVSLVRRPPALGLGACCGGFLPGQEETPHVLAEARLPVLYRPAARRSGGEGGASASPVLSEASSSLSGEGLCLSF